MLVGPCAHFDHVWEKQGGTFLQLGDVRPSDDQFGCGGGTKSSDYLLEK